MKFSFDSFKGRKIIRKHVSPQEELFFLGGETFEGDYMNNSSSNKLNYSPPKGRKK
jgi:hypothetical protein